MVAWPFSVSSRPSAPSASPTSASDARSVPRSSHSSASTISTAGTAGTAGTASTSALGSVASTSHPVPLTYREAELVRESVPFLQERGEEVSALMYRKMLAGHPELNNTFNLVHQRDGKLARAIATVILRYASNVGNMAELAPRLERVTNKHCTLGIGPQHYAVMGDCLLEAFVEVLGPEAMTDARRVAWAKAYAMLVGMVGGREQHMYAGMDADRWGSWRRLMVERRVPETPDGDVVSFYLVARDRGMTLVPFRPGQYVSIRVFVPEMGFHQTRQYSLTDAPPPIRPHHYRLTIKRNRGRPDPGPDGLASGLLRDPGLVSNLLLNGWGPGDEIDVSHPAGDFYYDTSAQAPESSPVVLISAGAGAGTLLSMFNTILALQPRRPVSWVHSCRGEAPFVSHVDKMRLTCPGVRRVLFKTAPLPEDVETITYDHQGRIDLGKLGEDVLHSRHGAAEYFLCGPEPFMQNVAAQLQGAGISLGRIKCELFSVGEPNLEGVC